MNSPCEFLPLQLYILIRNRPAPDIYNNSIISNKNKKLSLIDELAGVLASKMLGMSRNFRPPARPRFSQALGDFLGIVLEIARALHHFTKLQVPPSFRLCLQVPPSFPHSSFPHSSFRAPLSSIHMWPAVPTFRTSCSYCA